MDRDVAGLGEHANFEASQFPAHVRQRCGIAPGKNQIAAFASQGAGDGEADAASGAGDQGDAALEAMRGT